MSWGVEEAVSKPIDYGELTRMYNEATMADSKRANCQHFNAISVDEHGVYHINCKQCGAAGATNEAGARALGWIPAVQIPTPQVTPNFGLVASMVKDHVAAMSKPDYCEDNDTAHYIYEAAMEAVYGKDIWAWTRQVIK